jgi:hypothetical protein
MAKTPTPTKPSTKRQVALEAANTRKAHAANLAKKAVQAKKKGATLTAKEKRSQAKRVAKAKAAAKIVSDNAESRAGAARSPATPRVKATPPRKKHPTGKIQKSPKTAEARSAVQNLARDLAANADGKFQED